MYIVVSRYLDCRLKPLRHQKKVLKLSPIVESTLKIQKNDTKYVLCLRSDER